MELLECPVLDVADELWQIVVEIEMIPWEDADREFASRSVTPRLHVFSGGNPILIPDVRINWAR
ncbi:hypothetical protein BZL30_0655 [Mycobacterium kansasii]|uniref:Uncharacterized protein n=1 Tax=Mycobacterium kansasii TaxID=1768 RepID=A0A1V3XSK5_MYCKA|nr:hypothetical protein BZL30_0655 [Mycobacterium kansasii]